MKQSMLASWIEQCASTASGFLISLGLQYAVCWWFGLPLKLHDNLAIIAVFTLASLARGMAWRRLMEAFHVRRALTPFMAAAIAECYRQAEEEGYDHAHDDAHAPGVLAAAGAAYLAHAFAPPQPMPPRGFPWDGAFWNPKDPRRNLVRGAALALAEGNKLDRARRRKAPPQSRAQWPSGGVL
jgi:hypothetical protein